jgi:hypothetical protein
MTYTTTIPTRDPDIDVRVHEVGAGLRLVTTIAPGVLAATNAVQAGGGGAIETSNGIALWDETVEPVYDLDEVAIEAVIIGF